MIAPQNPKTPWSDPNLLKIKNKSDYILNF